MSVFAYLSKALFDSTVGRIRWRSSMWALVGGPHDKNRLQNERLAGKGPRFNERGELLHNGAVLVKKISTLCPKPPRDEFYSDGKFFWVPATVCRACQYHRKANRSFRFPRCTFKSHGDKTKLDAKIEAAIQTSEVFDRAIHRAKEIIK